MSAPDQGPRTAQDMPLPGGDFRLFVQKLAYQALIGLGVLDNPLTGQRSQRSSEARSVIDDLLMLRDKCRGNLEEEEDEHLNSILAKLEQHYAELERGST